jgi:hypothetical protein
MQSILVPEVRTKKIPSIIFKLANASCNPITSNNYFMTLLLSINMFFDHALFFVRGMYVHTRFFREGKPENPPIRTSQMLTSQRPQQQQPAFPWLSADVPQGVEKDWTVLCGRAGGYFPSSAQHVPTSHHSIALRNSVTAAAAFLP